MTRVYAKHNVDCPFSAAVEMLERFHSEGATHRVGPFAGFSLAVECELSEIRDHTDQARIHEALQLQWKARSPIPLPSMSCFLSVRPNGMTTELRVAGAYASPLGYLGAAFDWIVGRHIAQRTLERFLDEACTFVERAWQTERTQYLTSA